MKQILKNTSKNWIFQNIVAGILICICIKSGTYFYAVIIAVVMSFCYCLYNYIKNYSMLIKHKKRETKFRQELLKTKQRLNMVLNCIPIAVFFKDAQGKIEFENELSKRYFNLAEQEIVKDDFEIFKDKHCIQKEIKLKLRNNTEKWFHLNKFPIVGSNGELTGLCGVMRDINTEKLAQEQKETFVETLTHDLKTPTLAQIKAIDLILGGYNSEFSEEQKELLNLTKESCNYMLDMISNLLYTYKYENNDYILELESCDIKNLVEESCFELTNLLSENNNTISIHGKENKYISTCDRVQIKRVITNFLNNVISCACKNSTIDVELVKINDTIDVKITSNSMYINPSVLENLFNNYPSNATKFNKIGISLGLYLSKQIITAHGGKVYAQSLQDNKNIFGFIIPKEQKHTAPVYS